MTPREYSRQAVRHSRRPLVAKRAVKAWHARPALHGPKLVPPTGEMASLADESLWDQILLACEAIRKSPSKNHVIIYPWLYVVSLKQTTVTNTLYQSASFSIFDFEPMSGEWIHERKFSKVFDPSRQVISHSDPDSLSSQSLDLTHQALCIVKLIWYRTATLYAHTFAVKSRLVSSRKYIRPN